ncbi:MAG: putative baseplate assembly protein [Methylococcales bacterium]
MTNSPCLSSASAKCPNEKRRAKLRNNESKHLAGMDYVEVDPSGTTLFVHFFGQVPSDLTERNVVIEGGRRIRDIKVVSAQFMKHVDGDTCLRVTIDKIGDFSNYCICLIKPTETKALCLGSPLPTFEREIPDNIDPRYSCATLIFRSDCTSTLDCKTQPCPSEPFIPPPEINYLARDFQSFRQAMLDRLLVTMPEWRERHIPDIGITLVELMAYVADQLSYTLDSVATEAYLATARRRISVRRHARLVDYRMHEGCNSRAWITLDSDSDQIFDIADLAFAVPPDDGAERLPGLVNWETMHNTPGTIIFEAMDFNGSGEVSIFSAHSEIHFYTWEDSECCLPKDSTRATLLDETNDSYKSKTGRNIDEACAIPQKSYSSAIQGNPYGFGVINESKQIMNSERFLNLGKGDILILEEIRGTRTGSPADADPTKRHVVRLTKVTKVIDPLNNVNILEVEWGMEDALPFTLCLSSRTDAPDCKCIKTAVARGNVVLIDHGLTEEPNDNWVVEVEQHTGCCECEGAAVDVPNIALPLSITLPKPMLTYAETLDSNRIGTLSAAGFLEQNPRNAAACIKLDEGQIFLTPHPAATESLKNQESNYAPNGTADLIWKNSWDWLSKSDLLSSGPTDRHFVVEMDDERYAHLRFGDNDCGRQPESGLSFRARYRVNKGSIGNVGRDAIIWVARKSGMISGIRIVPRNPLAAVGGIDPEPVSEVKLYAPHAYSRVLERAVAAVDYADLAGRDSRIDSVYANLTWTGSWFEADVALDPYAKSEWDTSLADDVEQQLNRFRRIGHDLRIVPVHKVPLVICLNIRVSPHYSRSDVELAILEVLSTRKLADGTLGFFHPDNFEFGTDIKASRIVATVQKLEGVQHVEINEFRRFSDDPKSQGATQTLNDNFISINRGEIAQLDNDKNFPENGSITLDWEGGLCSAHAIV